METVSSGYNDDGIFSIAGPDGFMFGGIAAALILADSTGAGAGTQVSFYHKDEEGGTWDIAYAMYEEPDAWPFAYLLRQGDAFYTYAEDALEKVPIENLTRQCS